MATLLRAVRGHRRIPRRIALSGVDDAHLAAAHATGARVLIRREHIAPRLDLAAAGVDWIASRSANTRQQLRRSARAYGAVRMERAMTVAVAWEYLDALATLHQRRWHARGKPGAFAQTFFARFHRELIARGLPRDEIDLLRISAEGAVIGYLYNFRHRGRVLAYQSGFNYAAARGAQKPGMTCHQMAIDWYAAQGVRAYDFLAGADRYKRSLANAQTRLHWLSLYPVLSDLWRG